MPLPYDKEGWFATPFMLVAFFGTYIPARLMGLGTQDAVYLSSVPATITFVIFYFYVSEKYYSEEDD